MFYFLPEESGTPTIEHLRERGLGHGFDATVASRRCERGPSGGDGMLVAATDRQLSYNPERQRWRQLPTTSIWFGWDDTVGPDAYAKEKQLPGELVTMADGQQWLVPTARDFVAGGVICVLPMAYELQQDGKTWGSTTVLRQYQRYWDLSLELAINWAAPAGGKTSAFRFSDMFELVAEGLSINYRLSRLEVGVLGLLSSDPDIFHAVIRAAFGMSKFEAMAATEAEQKKTN